jgi:hypothetical protein
MLREKDHAVDYLKKAGGILLGALLLGLAVLAWGLVTGGIVSYAERAWCWNASEPASCHFRGVWTFLLWSIVGIANLLILGLLVERLGSERGRRR